MKATEKNYTINTAELLTYLEIHSATVSLVLEIASHLSFFGLAYSSQVIYFLEYLEDNSHVRVKKESH